MTKKKVLIILIILAIVSFLVLYMFFPSVNLMEELLATVFWVSIGFIVVAITHKTGLTKKLLEAI